MIESRKYGVIDNEGTSPLLVEVIGENPFGAESTPRYACVIVGIDAAQDPRYVRGHSGFPMNGPGYPWKESVELKHFDSDNAALTFGRKMVSEFRV